MRVFFHRVSFAGLLLAGSCAFAQTHKVAKPEQVVRAVGVYEWTGDMAKPTASRLIPVTIFIDGKLEDAGVYVARPVPFALLTGNVYELQDAGIDKGWLDLSFARHMQSTDAVGNTAYDDGWFGYGSVKAIAAPKAPPKLKASQTSPVLLSSNGSTNITSHPSLQNKTSDTNSSSGTTASKPSASSSSDDPDRPTMKRRTSDDSNRTATASTGAQTSTSDSSSKPTTSTSSDDPDRPTMKRRSDSSSDSGNNSNNSSTTSSNSSASTSSDDPDRPVMKRRSDSSTTDSTSTTASNSGSGSTPADDPDRPTMKRRTDSGNSTGSSSTTASSAPADDPDRPTLKRHSPEDAQRAKAGANDIAAMTGGLSLNNDPNRPSLHRGKPTGAKTEDDLPKLVGLPPETRQMVAVSDAANRDPHQFALAFDDPEQRAAILKKMQAMAQAQLAAYEKPSATKPTTPAPTAKKPTPTTTVKSRRAATSPAPAPAVMLMDEQLKAYTLSYGGAATYIYSAHTAGTGPSLRYVTIVAQADGLGELKPAIQNVTDAAHLDRAPRMRFIDVVDVEASNRASLLFELRGQTSRQFGLYRVIAAHSDQIFLTGTTQ